MARMVSLSSLIGGAGGGDEGMWRLRCRVKMKQRRWRRKKGMLYFFLGFLPTVSDKITICLLEEEKNYDRRNFWSNN